MNELVSKIGKVEQLELFPAGEFADTPNETLAEWINTGHAAIKMAVRRLAIHVAQVGAWLVAAKQKCQHGEWLEWLAVNCPEISQDTAERYRKVYLRYSAEMRNLTVTQAYRELGIVKDPTDKLKVEPPPLPKGKYRVIYADPPWQYRNTGFITSAEKQYPTMETEEICALPITDLVDDNAALFLWATNPCVKDALQVCESWGFAYKTNFVWVKPQHICGFYCYGQHELLFVAIKGSLLPKQEGIRSSIIDGHRREHSRKPDEVYSIIEKMYDGPYVELFARNNRKGWVNWGNDERLQ